MSGHRFSALVLALAFTTACTPTHRAASIGGNGEEACEQPELTSAVAATNPSTPLAIVQTRDHEIMVYSGQAELRFSVVLAKTGKLVADRIGAKEFERGFPGLHRNFETAFAEEHGHGSVIWAGADVPSQPHRGFVEPGAEGLDAVVGADRVNPVRE